MADLYPLQQLGEDARADLCAAAGAFGELWQQDLLYDPQTSGGLLMAVDPADADALMAELEGSVPAAQRVGRALEYDGGALIRLR